MLNRDLDEFVRCELSQLGAGLPLHDAAGPLPRRLFYPCDAAELDAVMGGGAVPAVDWRLGFDGPLVDYGVELVRAFLASACNATDDGLRRRFREHVCRHFDPRGTHFDGFVVRLFDIGQGTREDGFPGYALGLPSDALANVRLRSAIYSGEQQRAIVGALHRRYEDYLVSAVERFGEACADDVLPACTDRFRHEIGDYLMLFRDPGFSAEREWIALALAAVDGPQDPVRFEVRANRLVPVVSLDIARPAVRGRSCPPVDLIAIGTSLPAASTREALEAYLRWRGLAGVAVVAFGASPSAFIATGPARQP